MHLILNQEEISSALQTVSTVASGRNTLPILSNVMIEALDTHAYCIATDLDVGIRIQMNCDVIEIGTITVNCKKLLDIVKELPAGQQIVLETTANDRVTLTCGDGVYKLIGLSAEEFPVMPVVEGSVLTLDAQHFCNVLDKVEYAACKDDVRYFLNGVYFNFLENRTEVVATDSRMLSVAHLPEYQSPNEKNGFIVPLKAIKEIKKAFTDSAEINICISDDNQMLVSDDFTLLTTRLVEGEYPNYEAIIPDERVGKSVVSKDELLKSVRRVSLLSNPKNYSICLDFESDNLIVSAKTPDLGEAIDNVAIKNSTDTAKIGVDARLLLDNLNSIKSDNIVIEYDGSLSPVVMRPEDDDTHTCLLMPLRLDEL